MELPTILSSAYASSVVEPARWFAPTGLGVALPAGQAQERLNIPEALRRLQEDAKAQGLQVAEPRRMQIGNTGALEKIPAAQLNQQKAPPAMPNARIVKVFVADPNENLPLDKRVLYTGSEQLTDLTDQELFFEVPISELLKKHNELRVATRDKKAGNVNNEPVMLEPARIRDLKMVVVTVASF
jgi:hypothetical protein